MPSFPTLTNAQEIAFEYFCMALVQASVGWAGGVSRVALPLVVALGSVSRVKESTLKALAKKGALRIESYSLPCGDFPAGTLFCVKRGYKPVFSLGTTTVHIG